MGVGVYIELKAVFTIIMLSGEGLTFFLLPPEKVRRSDGPVAGSSESKRLANFPDIVKKELRSLLAIRNEKRLAQLWSGRN